jgi:hypothetical protein
MAERVGFEPTINRHHYRLCEAVGDGFDLDDPVILYCLKASMTFILAYTSVYFMLETFSEQVPGCPIDDTTVPESIKSAKALLGSGNVILASILTFFISESYEHIESYEERFKPYHHVVHKTPEVLIDSCYQYI